MKETVISVLVNEIDRLRIELEAMRVDRDNWLRCPILITTKKENEK